MIWVSADDGSVAAGGSIPFNTVICKTNDNVRLNSNKLEIVTPGWYTVLLQAALASTDAATVTVSMYAQDKVVDSETLKIGASGLVPISVEYPVHVVSAESGVAKIDWRPNAAVTVNDAVVCVTKVV